METRYRVVLPGTVVDVKTYTEAIDVACKTDVITEDGQCILETDPVPCYNA